MHVVDFAAMKLVPNQFSNCSGTIASVQTNYDDGGVLLHCFSTLFNESMHLVWTFLEQERFDVFEPILALVLPRW